MKKMTEVILVCEKCGCDHVKVNFRSAHPNEPNYRELCEMMAEALEHNTSEFAHDLALKNEALARYRELVEEKK